MTVIPNGVQAVHLSTESSINLWYNVHRPMCKLPLVVHEVWAQQSCLSDTFKKDGPWAKKDWERLIYDYLVISETRTTSNKPKETIRQIGNEQHDSHTNPWTVYVWISYQHQLNVKLKL